MSNINKNFIADISKPTIRKFISIDLVARSSEFRVGFANQVKHAISHGDTRNVYSALELISETKHYGSYLKFFCDHANFRVQLKNDSLVIRPNKSGVPDITKELNFYVNDPTLHKTRMEIIADLERKIQKPKRHNDAMFRTVPGSYGSNSR